MGCYAVRPYSVSLTKTNTLITMKRDWELLKEIIETVEKCDGGYPLVATNGVAYNDQLKKLEVSGRAFGEVFEHILLLGDAGLAEVRDLSRYDGPYGVAIDRLTMAGHDFLGRRPRRSKMEPGNDYDQG